MQELFTKIYKTIKSTALKLFPSHKGKTTRVFRFYKEHSGRWYIDLPEWKGGKWHLEMVSGADTLLDLLKLDDRNDVELYVSLEYFSGASTLEKSCDDPQGDGADYRFYNRKKKGLDTLWLCGVTEWYYGTMPEKIYFKKFLG